jgi:hypothetical protein
MAKQRTKKDDVLLSLILFFGLVSLFSGAKVLTQGEEQPRKAA